MSHRTVSVVLLFLAAMMISGVALALAIPVGRAAGVPMGRGILPVFLLLSFVPTFFVGRQWILPTELATPRLRAVSVITVWIAATMLAAGGLAWGLRPVIGVLGFGPGPVLIWLGCVIASSAVLDRVVRSRRPRQLSGTPMP